MSKKKKEHKLTQMGWILIIILCILFIAWISGLFLEEEFDDSKHVCEMWRLELKDDKEVYWDKPDKDLLVDYINLERNFKFNYPYCLKFRDKTLEELADDECNRNFNEENCFCEEYESFVEATRRIKEQCPNLTIPLSYQKSKICIKSRAKTPCEKGEEGWIEDKECIASISADPSSYCFVNFHNEKCCKKYKKFCRQKTFEDLTCVEKGGTYLIIGDEHICFLKH